jgi:hypothetical protein
VFAREAADARILHRHLYEPIPSLAACMAGWCPPALEAAIAACLAKEVADRPSDARSLAEQLRAIDLPAELDWSSEHAAAWWRAYQPAIPPTSVSTSEVQVIMPAGTDQRPVVATSETAIAQTIASPPPTATSD